MLLLLHVCMYPVILCSYIMPRRSALNSGWYIAGVHSGQERRPLANVGNQW